MTYDSIMSLILKTASPLLIKYYQEMKKEDYAERAAFFHSRIAPKVIERLALDEPELYQKLAKVSLKGREIVCPFVDISAKPVDINPHLALTRRQSQENKKFTKWMKDDLGKTLRNNLTFTLESISSHNHATIGISNYFSTISTSYIHYYNLIRYFPQETIDLIKQWLYYSEGRSWRETLRKAALEHNYSHYTASIGGSVLVVMKTSEGYRALIKVNSPQLASSEGEKHVIPSFMFGPITSEIKDQERELDFKTHIIKEYGEELLGMEECEQYDSIDRLNHIIESNPLLAKMKSGSSDIELYQTGFVLDIFRLRPEFTYVMVIHDIEYAKAIVTNWETKPNSLIHLDPYNEETLTELLDYTRSKLCPPGLAALSKGIQIARDAIERHQTNQPS